MVNKKRDSTGQGLKGESGLTTMAAEAMRGLVEAIRGIESPDWTNRLDSGHLTILDSGIVHDMLDQIQDKELGLDRKEKVTTLVPEEMQEILKRIQGETQGLYADEILWRRRTAARPHSQALFDAALDVKQSDRVASDLDKAAQLSHSADTIAFLEDPEVRFEDKTRLLEQELGKMHPLVMNLVYDLLSKRKLNILTDILDEYRRLRWGHDFVVRAEVATAIPLDEDDKHRIAQRLRELIGRNVMLESRVDPSIVGGFVVTIGSQKIDASLRSKLATLRNNLYR